MNEQRCRLGLVANMGELYAIGGCNERSALESVEKYNPETGFWTFSKSMCYAEGELCAGIMSL